MERVSSGTIQMPTGNDIMQGKGRKCLKTQTVIIRAKCP